MVRDFRGQTGVDCRQVRHGVYVQHNPNVPDGRAAMVEFISRRNPTPKPLEVLVKAPLASIIAERALWYRAFFESMPIRKMHLVNIRPLGSTCFVSRMTESSSTRIQLCGNKHQKLRCIPDVDSNPK